jgi:hypothetical protein
MTDAPTTTRTKRTIDIKLRRRIERAVERLITALDALDAPAEDLEETDPPEGPDPDAEPSLGSNTNTYQGAWATGSADDREDEHDGAEPSEDGEPLLGSFDRMTDQRKSWRQREGNAFCGLDAEADDSDREPSLGSVTSGWGSDRHSQEDWAGGGRDDREDDPAEAGIADIAALARLGH